MTQDEIIDMARQAGFEDLDNWTLTSMPWLCSRLEAFAKLVMAKEREKWKEIVEDQRLRLQALNEIIGGEGSTTTGNILSYSRWEQRLEDAVKEEREACAKVCEDREEQWRKAGFWKDVHEFREMAFAIRSRGEE